jgi:hypothetical protein
MPNRKNEQPKTWFRSDRVFRSDGYWYFHTREGIDVGPYKDKFEAEVDAEMLKSLLVGASDSETQEIIARFMGDDRTIMRREIPPPMIDFDIDERDLKNDAFTSYLLEEGLGAIQSGSA